MDYLGKLKTVLTKTTQRVATAVRKKLLDPIFKKQQTVQIKTQARPSIYEILQRRKTEKDEQGQNLLSTKKKNYDMDR